MGGHKNSMETNDPLVSAVSWLITVFRVLLYHLSFYYCIICFLLFICSYVQSILTEKLSVTVVISK